MVEWEAAGMVSGKEKISIENGSFTNCSVCYL